MSNISETFEHYLAWTVGALVNLVNLRLEAANTETRLPAMASWHLRHGVDTPQALALLNASITSRSLAHQVGQTATGHGVSDRLRSWLSELHVDGWREHFSATEYEINDLLEYVRKHRPSVIGALLDMGRVSVDVQTIGAPSTHPIPVQIRPAPGPEPATLIVDDGTRDRALIPADTHVDVHTVIDSGVDFETALIGDLLTSSMPSMP